MKRAWFIILWMFVSFLLGCQLFVAVVMAVNFKRAATGEKSTPLPNNRLVNLAIVYSLPTLALVLGVMGKLPGTRREKPRPPVIGNSMVPPVLPPATSQGEAAGPISDAEQIAAVVEKVIQQKFGQDRALLSPELFEALLRCVVDKKTFRTIAAQSGRPDEPDIAAFEQVIGFSLPEDYRRYARSGFGCLFVEVNESVWPRPKEGAIVPAWHIQFALYVYGLSSGVPDFMDIRKQFAGFSKGGSRLVPFLRVEGSLNQYCFSPEGRIVRWDADTREAKPEGVTFTALLLREIVALQERAQRIQKEPNPYDTV